MDHGLLSLLMVNGSLRDDQKKTLVGCGFSAAIVAAPFIALLYDVTIALVVLVLALGSTSYATLHASRDATRDDRRRLRALLAVNVVFLIVAMVALGWLLVQE